MIFFVVNTMTVEDCSTIVCLTQELFHVEAEIFVLVEIYILQFNY